MINQDRLVQTFLDLVKIDSPSGHEKAMAEEVAKRLEKLGAAVEFDSYGNVIGHFEGKGEPFMLNAHLDTVEPGRNIKPIVEHDIIKSDGTTILGADPKAGVSAILEALTSLNEDTQETVPLDIVFTLGEENGLYGATYLAYDKIRAKRGITFDGEGEPHNIDLSAPGLNRINAIITGRSAHSGVEPEKGISAIRVASEIIAQLPLGRLDEETTANVGIISGGNAWNSVPEKVEFKGEIRSRNLEKLEQYSLEFHSIANTVLTHYPGAKLDLVIKREFDPYEFTDDHKMIAQIKTIFTELGKEARLLPSGGGTDVNIFHTHGLETVVIGTGAYEMHTTREYVEIPQMLEAAQFCEMIVEKMRQENDESRETRENRR